MMSNKSEALPSDFIALAESHVQMVLDQQINMQIETSDINCSAREKTTVVLNKEIDELAKDQAKFESLMRNFTWINSIATVFQITLSFFLQSGSLALSEGILLITAGIFAIRAGMYRWKTAKAQEKVNKNMAFEQYIGDRNSNNDMKLKNAYESLTNLAETFNKMITIIGMAKQKNK